MSAALKQALEALRQVEDWWLTQADQSGGAPYCIFSTRAAIPAAEAELSREQPARVGLTDELIARLVLQTVYEGDASTPHREAWAAEIGIPFARAIERAHNIPAAPTQERAR